VVHSVFHVILCVSGPVRTQHMSCARRSKNDELYEKRKQLTDLLEAARVEKEEVSALTVFRCTENVAPLDTEQGPTHSPSMYCSWSWRRSGRTMHCMS
jgi:hypothetical protein